MTISIPKRGQKRPIVTDIGGYHWLVHADGGLGKTSIAAQFPDVLFLATEHGQSAVEVEVLDIPDWNTIAEFAKQFRGINAGADYGYKTLVIDTLDRLYEFALQATIDGTRDKEINMRNQQVIWGQTNIRLRLLFNALQATGCSLIFLTHYKAEMIDKDKAAKKAARPSNIPDYSFSVPETLGMMVYNFVDFCLFLSANDKGIRTFHTRSGHGYRAKCRHELPDTIQMGRDAGEAFANLKKEFDKAVALKVRGGGAAAQTPAPETEPPAQHRGLSKEQVFGLMDALKANSKVEPDATPQDCAAWLEAELGYKSTREIDPADLPGILKGIEGGAES